MDADPARQPARARQAEAGALQQQHRRVVGAAVGARQRDQVLAALRQRQRAASARGASRRRRRACARRRCTAASRSPQARSCSATLAPDGRAVADHARRIVERAAGGRQSRSGGGRCRRASAARGALRRASRAGRRGNRRPRRPATSTPTAFTGAHRATVAAPGASVTCAMRWAMARSASSIARRTRSASSGAPSSAACSVRDELAARHLRHRAAAHAVGDDEQRPGPSSGAVRVFVALVLAAARRRDRGLDAPKGRCCGSTAAPTADACARRAREARRAGLQRRDQAARHGVTGACHVSRPARASVSGQVGIVVRRRAEHHRLRPTCQRNARARRVGHAVDAARRCRRAPPPAAPASSSSMMSR